MKIVEAENETLGDSIAELEISREHDSQPGSAALGIRDDDEVGLLESAILSMTSQPTFESTSAIRGKKERQLQTAQPHALPDAAENFLEAASHAIDPNPASFEIPVRSRSHHATREAGSGTRSNTSKAS